MNAGKSPIIQPQLSHRWRFVCARQTRCAKPGEIPGGVPQGQQEPNTRLRVVCATRSRIVGMPSGLFRWIRITRASSSSTGSSSYWPNDAGRELSGRWVSPVVGSR